MCYTDKTRTEKFCQTIGRDTNDWKNPILRALFIFTDPRGVPALRASWC